MIVCTHCGAQNSDEAEKCEVCGWKLQSGWALAGCRSEGGRVSDGPRWRAMEPLRTAGIDAQARKLLLGALETLAYVGLLLAGAAATMLTDDWWYAAACAGLVAGLAWVRGI